MNISSGILQFANEGNSGETVIQADCIIGKFEIPDPCVKVTYSQNSVEIFFAGKQCETQWKSWYTALIAVGGVLILAIIATIIIFKCSALKKNVLPFSGRKNKVVGQ